MSLIKQHIESLAGKLSLLLKRYDLLQKENSSLRKKLSDLTHQHEKAVTLIDDLKQQQLILKAAAAPLNEKDKKEMEQKINGYLKQIDKCISILEK